MTGYYSIKILAIKGFLHIGQDDGDNIRIHIDTSTCTLVKLTGTANWNTKIAVKLGDVVKVTWQRAGTLRFSINNLDVANTTTDWKQFYPFIRMEKIGTSYEFI